MATTDLPATTAAAPPYATAHAWARFTTKTIATAGHLLWLGAIADDGYGRFHDPDYRDQAPEKAPGHRPGSPIVRVSRWMWWAWHGPIPTDRVVLHRCDLPICCRLECLELGTQADNLGMASRRNRIARRGAGGRLDVADHRGQAAQSRAIRDLARAALLAGIRDPQLLDDLVRIVVAAGDPRRDQLPLFT